MHESRTMNDLVDAYTEYLRDDTIRQAYTVIIKFMSALRRETERKGIGCRIGGLYQGYMDMTYFPIETDKLKERGLKIAIVYLHKEKRIEAWLSARNRQTASAYAGLEKKIPTGHMDFRHHTDNPDAILEALLSSHPDFDNPSSTIDQIIPGIMEFIDTVTKSLERES